MIRPRILSSAVCAAITVIALVYFWTVCKREFMVLDDEGAILYAADIINRGGTIYTDALVTNWPGVYYFTALLFAIFGPGILAARIAAALAGTAMAPLVYLLARRLSSITWSAAAALCFICWSMSHWNALSCSWFSVLFSLLALTLYTASLSRKGPHFLLACGLCIGLSLLSKQNQGALAWIALALHIIISSPREERTAAAGRLALFAISSAIPVIAAAGLLIRAGAFREWILDTVWYPVTDFNFIGTHFHFPPIPSLSEPETLMAYFPLAVFIAGIVRFMRSSFEEARTGSVVLLFVIFTGTIYLGVFLGIDPVNHLFTLPTSFILLSWILGQEFGDHSGRVGSARASVSPPGGIIGNGLRLCLLAAIALFGFTSSADLIAGRFRPLEVERAEGIALEPATALQVESLVETIRGRTEAGEKILVIDNAPMIYFLAERDSPTRHISLFTGNFAPEDLLEVIEAMERENCRTVVYIESPARWDGVVFMDYAHVLYRYLVDHYKIMGHYGDFTLYGRKPAQYDGIERQL